MLHAFAAWRNQLTTIEHLTAYRTVLHNLVTANAPPEPVSVAAITASAAFVVAHTRRSSAGNSCRRTSRKRRPHRGSQGNASTIVGVMPAGFAFPVDHDSWRSVPAGIP